MLLVPKNVTLQWQTACAVHLQGFKVILYDSEGRQEALARKDIEAWNDPVRTIVITTYGILSSRHSATAVRKATDLGKVGNLSPDLKGLFGLLIVDEAHLIKNVATVRFEASRALDADQTVLLTGTPISNRTEDVLGLLSLLQGDKIWSRTNLDPDAYNPFEDDAHPELRATAQAFERYVRDIESPSEQGKLVKAIYREVLLRRTYATIVDGQRIGEDIPPQTTRRVDVIPDELNRKELIATIQASKSQLFHWNDSSETLILNAKTARDMVQSTTWLPFKHLGHWGAKDLEKYWRKESTLRDFMSDICLDIKEGKLGFNPRTLSDDELLDRVASKSPKLQALMGIVADITMILHTKLVVWAEYPAEQVLILKFLQMAGISAEAYHAGLSDSQRAACVSAFNDAANFKVLVTTYRVACFGINLQDACYHTIIFAPSISIAYEAQAMGRVHRLGQKHSQIVIILNQIGAWDQWLRANQLEKSLASVYAEIDDNKNIRWRKPDAKFRDRMLKELVVSFTGLDTTGWKHGIVQD